LATAIQNRVPETTTAYQQHINPTFLNLCTLFLERIVVATLAQLYSSHSTICAFSMTDYDKLKVPDLKKLLSERSLPVSGNKSDLISRLQESDNKKPTAGT
jgi:hypothetical protein